MSADLRDARIRLYLEGGVALVADADGIDRWQVHGRPANPAEEFVLRGTTVADMEEVCLLVDLQRPSPVERQEIKREIKELYGEALRMVTANMHAVLAAHPGWDAEEA